MKGFNTTSKNKNKRSLVRGFVGLLNGDFLTRENVLKNMPYLFFVTLLIIGYIGNTHYSEKMVRETDKITRELKELGSEYITVKFELMFKSRQSEVANSVAGLGIYESVKPPMKITVSNN